jgi:hypothetical protein
MDCFFFEIAKLFLEYIKVLIWPSVVIFLVLLFYRQLSALLGRIKSANLPGGVSLDFNEAVQEIKKLSKEVEPPKPPKGSKKMPMLPLTEANSKMLKLGLQPSPSGLDFKRYRELAIQDPNLALAGLRIELETMLKNVAKGFNLSFSEKESTGMILRKLQSAGNITLTQYELSSKVFNLCNMAVHGSRVSNTEANTVIDIAETLADQYVKWLSWGFPK